MRSWIRPAYRPEDLAAAFEHPLGPHARAWWWAAAGVVIAIAVGPGAGRRSGARG